MGDPAARPDLALVTTFWGGFLVSFVVGRSHVVDFVRVSDAENH